MSGSPGMARSDGEISLAPRIQEADLRTASVPPAEALFLRPGDVVELSADAIESLGNPALAAPSAWEVTTT